MSNVALSRYTLNIEGTGLTVQLKKCYYSTSGGTISSDGWRLCGDGNLDDPDGVATTVTLTEGSEDPVGSGYYNYYGNIENSGNYTLYINSVVQERFIGIMIFAMDLMQYIQGNYEHRNASSNVHGIGSGNSVVGTGTTQTLTSKTLTTPVIAQIKPDSSHTLTLPQLNDTIVSRTANETLTNKTLTTPVVASIKPDASHTLTLPVATDTLIGKATTDTLENKTIDAPEITNGIVANGATIELPSEDGILPLTDDLISSDDVIEGLSSGTTASISVLKYIMSQLLSSTKFSDMLAYSGFVSTGDSAPSTAPTREGLIYINTTAGTIYISVGLTSSDWKLVTAT
jgi:hypothetical protein